MIAFDTETTLISYPDNVCPRGVCLTAYDGIREMIWHLNLEPERSTALAHLQGWLEDDRRMVVGHNISFDLHVVLKEFPELWSSVWKALKAGRVHDTMLREKLYMLGTVGSTHAKPCSLAALVQRHLGEDISHLKEGDVWRLRYEELIETPTIEWPHAASQYAIGDAVYTWRVWQAQEAIRQPRGPGSMNSAAVQVAAAFALYGMTIQGMRIDSKVVDDLRTSAQEEYDEAVSALQSYGIIRENGTRDQKALAALCTELGVTELTASGRVATGRKVLDQIVSDDPRLEAYRHYSNTVKAVTTFIPQMSVDRVHPSFNPLINTLRTSCRSSNYYKYGGKEYGVKKIKRGDPVPSINLQQIPRAGGFRKAFIPEPGHVFLAADYANLELVCAAQTYYQLFGKSALRSVLNRGVNLHDATGTLIYNDYLNANISISDFRKLTAAGDSDAKFCRQSAKFVNLGCPGGQSAKTICSLANGLGIPITLKQAEAWRHAARGRFPEYAQFFEIWFPQLKNGYMYLTVDKKQKKVQRYDGEIYGVWKARATYTALSNSISMQVPAALGKKRALIRIYERCTNPGPSVLYGSYIHLDMHDEFILSVSEDKAVECQAELTECMIDGMQQILPDMRVAVESCIMRRWGKDPEPEFGSQDFFKNPLKEAKCTT